METVVLFSSLKFHDIATYIQNGLYKVTEIINQLIMNTSVCYFCFFQNMMNSNANKLITL